MIQYVASLLSPPRPPQLSSPVLSPYTWSTRSRIQLADLSSPFGLVSLRPMTVFDCFFNQECILSHCDDCIQDILNGLILELLIYNLCTEYSEKGRLQNFGLIFPQSLTQFLNFIISLELTEVRMSVRNHKQCFLQCPWGKTYTECFLDTKKT